MEIKDILNKIGLTREESAIYLALLRNGPMSISDISRKTKLYRPVIYNSIPLLRERGIVSATTKGKRERYAAASPEKLSIMVDNLASELKEALPSLLGYYRSGRNRPTVTFFEGREGIQSVYHDIVTTLNKGDIFYRYSSSSATRKKNYYVPADYMKLRDEKKLERYVITNETTNRQKKPRLEKAVKVVPKNFDLFEYNVTQLIYSDKIAFVDYNTETAVIIENPIIAEFQKKIFKLLFQKL